MLLQAFEREREGELKKLSKETDVKKNVLGHAVHECFIAVSLVYVTLKRPGEFSKLYKVSSYTEMLQHLPISRFYIISLVFFFFIMLLMMILAWASYNTTTTTASHSPVKKYMSKKGKVIWWS